MWPLNNIREPETLWTFECAIKLLDINLKSYIWAKKKKSSGKNYN